jgi:putative tryptophan/tyrosine transport system substrate-binding protein
MSIARRTLLTGGLAVMGSGYPLAQASRIPCVGFLTPATSDRTIPISAFRTALAELGYVEGQNVILEFRLARGDISRLPALAAELAALPADVIVVDGGITVPAVMNATKTIPVVMATAGDPVALGYVQSLSRPGGNVTGFSLISGELNQKRLDLLRAAFPTAKNVAVLFNPENPTARAGLAWVKDAGEKLGIGAAFVELSSPDAILTLSSDALRAEVPVLVVPDVMFWNSRHAIIKRLEGTGLSALYPEREYADDGGLMAYGPNVPDNFKRAAGYVDRILKGAKPGDLPIQQPSRFDFIINMRTARELGVTLPQAMVLSAGEVIE